MNFLITSYAAPGPLSDITRYADWIGGLPGSIGALSAVVQNLLVHVSAVHHPDPKRDLQRRREASQRPIEAKLAAAIARNSSSPATPRAPEERVPGTARDAALLLAALLRFQGIPSRIRCGFAPAGDHYARAWVCEHWDARQERWLLADPGLTTAWAGAADPADLPRASFVTAAQAWRRYQRSPDQAVGMPDPVIIQDSIVRDALLLARVELLEWDLWWGDPFRKRWADMTPHEQAEFTQLADLVADADADPARLRDFYDRHPALGPLVAQRLRQVAAPPAARQSGDAPPDAGDQSTRFMRRWRSHRHDREEIAIRNAYQHNLKHLDLTVPRNKLVVMTGVSGSGKSSLAFDTIFAEGQHRYVHSLSTYARQYIGQVDRPRVEHIVGLSPAISIEQKTVSKNPRSSVGTITEISTYLRLLFSRVGTARCLACHAELPALADLDRCPRCATPAAPLSAALFSPNTPAGMCPDCHGLGTRLEVDPARIIDSPEQSLLDGASRWFGNLRQQPEKKSSKYWLTILTALAEHYQVDLTRPWSQLPASFQHVLLHGSDDERIRVVHVSEWADGHRSSEQVRAFPGVVPEINRLFRQTESEEARRYYAEYMSQLSCPGCQGTRLCAEARAVTLDGRSIVEVGRMTIDSALAWFDSLLDVLPPAILAVAHDILYEIGDRLQFLLNVGLHYLTLDRPAPTLSGGEGQRIRLASQLGCGLVGVLYVLDEPSIGLHPRDQRALIETLRYLRDLGNTVIVVEHDMTIMRHADWLIDLGPGAGIQGGEIVAEGLPEVVATAPHSLTGRYLSGDLAIVPPGTHTRTPAQGWLRLRGAALHNLRSVDVEFPLGLFVCVTGVSGSGKSSLVSGTLYPALHRALHAAAAEAGPYHSLEGLELVNKVIRITQEPIGRTPRSNPATYSGIFDDIRVLLAATAEAKAAGFKPNRFSFNVKGGRCEACQGYSQRKIEMHFLADVWIICEACGGQRFNEATLAIRYRGKNIADILALDIAEAAEFFADHPPIARTLQTLISVGLDYLKLGQSATTLSGGEAQRLKLASELSRVATGRTIYILDEPTTGLHFADIQQLLNVLHRLVDVGNTVIVIEHNLELIRTADWVIDLGPDGGPGGGMVVAAGEPALIADVAASYTGQALRRTAG